ncbi:glycosyltransferase [Streptomyces sp. NBC_01381]|uniref:glycosyltransferase n=1 Tax=Streptomyces sp. NBC_01381 TaxID=2903845 RepID=UPI00225BBEA3|nr:glycosyltransferase [Streptomyces sp. NBC_01381]MCX4666489.1 glycosyltransferase [Streptomyces sp. NBC_01381]
MKIAMIIPPFRYGADPSQWITVPPQGYGGIQWVAATLIDGLLETGCEVLLLGAPGSPPRSGLTVSTAIERDEIRTAIDSFGPAVVHDHSNLAALPLDGQWPVVSTHHLNGVPASLENGVYVSAAQRLKAGSETAPVIRLPVNPERCLFQEEKDDYLLFMGRVSAHKGAYEAAVFAHAANLPLKVAGPAWEPEYLDRMLADYPHTVDYIGEVGGHFRTELIAHAKAILVLSQTSGSPFGGRWAEPGATVVSEAAASGTPVIASNNGCLPEIVPSVGTILPSAPKITATTAKAAMDALPTAHEVLKAAVDQWGHLKIAQEYLTVYERAARGERWT